MKYIVAISGLVCAFVYYLSPVQEDGVLAVLIAIVGFQWAAGMDLS